MTENLVFVSAPRQASTIVEVETFPIQDVLSEAEYGSAHAFFRARSANLVKIRTADGTVGWGEASGEVHLMAPFMANYGKQILGTSVADRENFILKNLANKYHLGANGAPVFAMSAFDIACWDAQARAYHVPVSDILGGRVRNKVYAYASTGYFTKHTSDLDGLRKQLDKAAEEGFTAVKIRIGTGPRADRARVKLTRKILGDDSVVLVDYVTNGTYDSALASIAATRDLGVAVYEELLPPEDVSGYQMLRQTGVTLAGGESLATRYGFRDAITQRRFDLYQPDLAECGGLTEGRAIAELAVLYNSRVSPHCWGSSILQAAGLQLLATIPDIPFGDHEFESLIFEFDCSWNPHRDRVVTNPPRAEGSWIDIPTGDGLGVDIDEEWVKAHRVKECAIHLAI